MNKCFVLRRLFTVALQYCRKMLKYLNKIQNVANKDKLVNITLKTTRFIFDELKTIVCKLKNRAENT